LTFSLSSAILAYYEYYLPAEKKETGENARIFKENALSRGQDHDSKTAKEGKKEINRVMLLKAASLKKTREFQRVFSRGKGFSAGNLLLKINSPNENKIRFGIVISKKVAKQAVTRNRIRRVLKEALRQEQGRIIKGVEAVLVVLPGFQDQGVVEARKALRHLFQKASLFQ
jgi:ribonuclease P protein component